MRLHKITCLAQQLNAALGSGKYHDITYKDVWRQIDGGRIFEFLIERLGIAVPLSLLDPVDRLELEMEWDSMRTCVEPFRFDGHHSGLCLLVGYMLEGIARRAGNRDYRLTPELFSRVLKGDDAHGVS